MDDLISRQVAINTVKAMFDCCDTYDIVDYRDLMIEAFSVLSSVHPSPCEFCKHNDTSDEVACLMCPAERRTDE